MIDLLTNTIREVAKKKYLLFAILSTLLSRTIILISNIVFSRNSSIDSYGHFSFYINNIIIISDFLTLGFSNTIIQKIASKSHRDDTHFIKSTFALCLIIFLVINAANHFLLINRMLDQSALVIFFLLFYNLFIAYLMGKQNFKLAAFFNILYSFLFLISSIISINRLSDINTFFTFSFGVMLLIAGVYSSFRLKSIKLLCLDFVKYKSVYINYTLPAFLSTIVLMPIFLVCYNAIVTTKGYQEFGLFNAANQWRNVVLFFPVIVSKFTLSYLSNNINNKINFKRILKINLLINLTVTLCLCVVVYLSSAYLLEVFSIHKLVDKQLLFILVLSTIPITLNEVVGQVIASRENYWYGFILNSLWAISLLVCFYFVFGISSLGLSYSILTSYSFLLILSMAYSYKKILTL